MSISRIRKANWLSFFDGMSRLVAGKVAAVEVTSLEIGSQIVVENLKVVGLVYDPKDDVVEIALDGFDHLVHRPSDVFVDGPPFGRASLTIVDGDGALQILNLREPLLLSAPNGRH